jgi:hypothetical protein
MNVLLALIIPLSGFLVSNLHIEIQKEDYPKVCQEIKTKKSTVDSTNLKNYFISSFYYKIFPHWKGTKWDYEGYTNKPGEGVVACGYFVSTPLKHMGVNWNRYKLAQMYASKATDAICDNIKSFRKLEDLYNHIKNGEDNIYHVGLSFHVGLIIKYKGVIKFLHSDYIEREGVKEEDIMKSEALKQSDIYYIGRLTNSVFLEKWKNGTEISFN